MSTDSGIPNVKQYSMHFSATSSAVCVFIGKTFMCFVKWSHITNMYLCPSFVIGNGPAISIVTNCRVLAGAKGTNFGLQYTFGGFTFWQSKHSPLLTVRSYIDPEEPRLNFLTSFVDPKVSCCLFTMQFFDC